MQRQKNLFVLLACASLLPLGAIVPAAAQQANAYQGVSKPPAEQMDTTPDAPPPPPVAQAPQPAPDSVQVTVQTVPPAPMAAAPQPSADPDGGLVQPRQARPGELMGGATIQVRLAERLSSTESEKGDIFRGQVARDVIQDGAVLIPAGSGIEGTIASVSTGKLGGHGSLRLRPDFVILPDGTKFRLRADATGTLGSHTRMGSEGAINPGSRVGRDSIEYGAVVGAGAITGAVLGGPLGAVTGGLIGAGVVTTHLMVSHPQTTLEKGSIILFTLTDSLQMTQTATN